MTAYSDQQVDLLEDRGTNGNHAPVRVVSEPMTYERHGQYSYFRDLALRDVNNDDAARRRLIRHAQEMRATPGATFQSSGGYFVAPLWLNKFFATAPRPGRVLSQLIPKFPLPPNVAHSISTPRVTTGTITNGTPDNAPVPEQDLVDAGASSTVAVISGYSDWSLQALEQSPSAGALDRAIFQDLSEAYDYALEQQLIYGTGATSTTSTTGQLQGVLSVTGINKVTNNGSANVQTLYPNIGGVAAQIGNKRLKPPQCWLMNTSRWFWITSSVDTSQRPITTPDTTSAPPLPVDGSDDPPAAIGAMMGRIPVFVTDAIPQTFAGTNLFPTNGNQDVIIGLRPADMMFFESDPSFMTVREPLSSTMGVRFVYRASSAAFTSRFPTGIGALVGSGMAIQSGF